MVGIWFIPKKKPRYSLTDPVWKEPIILTLPLRKKTRLPNSTTCLILKTEVVSLWDFKTNSLNYSLILIHCELEKQNFKKVPNIGGIVLPFPMMQNPKTDLPIP